MGSKQRASEMTQAAKRPTLTPSQGEIIYQGTEYFGPPEAPIEQRLAKTFVTVKVIRKLDSSNRIDYILDINTRGDPISMFEGSAAIYWDELFRKTEFPQIKLLEWCRKLKADTNNYYAGVKLSLGDRIVERDLLVGLTRASMHYAFAHANEIDGPLSAEILSGIAKGKAYRRHELYVQSQNFLEVEHAGNIDADFLEHLNKSIAGG